MIDFMFALTILFTTPSTLPKYPTEDLQRCAHTPEEETLMAMKVTLELKPHEITHLRADGKVSFFYIIGVFFILVVFSNIST
jgi:hypothetical protein